MKQADVLVLATGEPKFDGSILTELAAAADKGIIRKKAGELQRFVQEHGDEGVFVVKGQGRIFRRYGIDDKQGD